MAGDKTFDTFCSIFRGNTSFYVKHQGPFEEKNGKLKAKYCNYAVYTKRNPAPEGKEDGDYIPVTKELYREHLNGGDGLAIAPLADTDKQRNICWYAVIDIDVYGVKYTWLVKRLYQAGFKFAAFLSKSGGLHIYFFFADPEPGDKVIDALNKIIEVYGLDRLFVNEKNKSKVEVFPKQAVIVPGDQCASCCMLPYYNTANGSKQKMLTAEGKLLGLEKALKAIDVLITSVKEINQVLSDLPYSDAPFCIQMLLLTGGLQEGGYRNNFLFSAAIYLKKKHKENFETALDEMNNCLEAPLEQEEIDSIYSSVASKSYDNYWCKKSPCSDYCDKKLCAMREYGVGRKRNNLFTGADCWGELSRIDAGDGKQPSYKWKVRVKEGEDYRELTIDKHEDLMNQKAIQTYCLRDLNWIPTTVKQIIWEDNILKSLEGIEERTTKVSRATDTTEYSKLHEAFLRFLSSRNVRKTQPYSVGLRQVYYSDGTYFFTTDGFYKFLDVERFPVRGINMRDRLTDYGCSESNVTYKTGSGKEMSIKCWKKIEDEELSEMSEFYGSVYDGDADIIQNNITNKQEVEKQKESGDEDVKF